MRECLVVIARSGSDVAIPVQGGAIMRLPRFARNDRVDLLEPPRFMLEFRAKIFSTEHIIG